MNKAWTAVRSMLANPGLVKAGPALGLFLLGYMRKFRLRERGGHLILHSHLPPLNGPAYGRFVTEHLVRRRSGPSHAQIAVTNECPQRCDFCYNRDRAGTPLRKDEILRTIDQLAEAGVFWLGLTGGEPLTSPDLVEIVARGAARCAVKLFTTGCGLTPALARDLKAAGLFSVSVSLDHWDEAEHDRGRRYPGAYREALRAIGIFRDAGLDTGASVVLSKALMERGQTARFLGFLEGLGVDEIWLSEVKPTIPQLWDEALLLTPDERNELRALQDRHNRGHGPTLNYLGQFEGPAHFGCTAGRKMVYVDAFGEVSPCVFVPMTFGNVRTEPLEGILRTMRSACRFRSRCLINEHYGLLRDEAARGLPVGRDRSVELLQRARGGQPSRFFELHARRYGPQP
ncbi:MAG TPA: radical SAM protein [Gemmatimonadales bacterium]|nr:radical SAM protein [Gemmatimonadales bacterium]